MIPLNTAAFSAAILVASTCPPRRSALIRALRLAAWAKLLLVIVTVAMGQCLCREDTSVEVAPSPVPFSAGSPARKSSQLSSYSTASRHVAERPARIAAFNVRRFGRAKMRAAEVVDVLVRIVGAYDVVLIQARFQCTFIF